MAKIHDNPQVGCAVSRANNSAWRRLADSSLPIAPADSIWRYSRNLNDLDPVQGWKLHISATILNANAVFRKVCSYLARKNVLFKGPRSLDELKKINCGLQYGYSQVGKFITVYPATSTEAVTLARKLDELTRNFRAPAVPFDSAVRPGSCIYYRYGSFINRTMESEAGLQVLAIRDPGGELIPDQRTANQAGPSWVSDPFVRPRSTIQARENPFGTTYRVFQSLSQRGKGGVYKAFDCSVQPPRLCILKEGRRDGEIDWNGRDGRYLVEREAQVLRTLRSVGLDVPRIYSSFEYDENHYLASELIWGESLHAHLYRRRRRLSIRQALNFAFQLATLLREVHNAGWAWRDCKPANLMVTASGKLRPIDFEGATQINERYSTEWSTPAFSPPQDKAAASNKFCKETDLYALGTVIYLLLTGRLPLAKPLAIERLRKGIDQQVVILVAALLSRNPRNRPSASDVCARLPSPD